ncbi:MAG: DDE-type integrase/transposase/recombinase, partial [Planctomycetota bacterium]
MTPKRSMWALADRLASLLMFAATTARARMLAHSSPLVRVMGQRDHAFSDAALLERELGVFPSQRHRKPANQRTHYAPEERAEILQVMRLSGWSAKQAGQRFVVHPNTIRNWQRAVEDKLRAERALGSPPWNRLHDGVRWLIHELRRTFSEPEFGTRTIARHIMRAGVRVSRTTIRRVIQEEPPRNARRHPSRHRRTKAPSHVQHPATPHQVWHLDLTTLRILWKQVEIAAIVDGFTRKIVALRAFGRRPTTDDLAKLAEDAGNNAAAQPRYLVTDHGSQFRQRFRAAVGELGVTHVRCQVRTWHLNAKVERVFRDIKAWARRTPLLPMTDSVQARLDGFRDWHNGFKPHTAHDILTPNEAEDGLPPFEATR